MKSDNYLPRLAVVAAIVDGDKPRCGPVTSAARMGSKPREVAGLGVDSATTQERALARALQGGDSRKQTQGDPAMADLLYLADACPGARKLAAGLSQAFLAPGDPASGLPEQDRRSAFADLYRRLALHQLDNQVRNKAAAALRGLSRSARRRGVR